MKTLYSILFFLGCLVTTAHAQDTLRVLFLGNSYTSVNNLPNLVQSLSNAAGKTLIVDANMPGGFTISGHVNDATSISKINLGTWDYIVVQEQSQVPTIPYYRYNDMYPALTDLKMMAEQANPCVKIITYMTWGRRFGGQQCDPGGVNCSPVFVDFNHMQDSLTSAYMEISNQLNVQCAPVGVTWKKVLNDTTLVLHSSDNSHPNIDGSYLAACSIFSSLWKMPATGNAFTAGIPVPRVQYYQMQSDSTLFFGVQDWNLNINLPQASFSFVASGNTVAFTNTSNGTLGSPAPITYSWSFGDGATSTQASPEHMFNGSGNYPVRLVLSSCLFSDTVTQVVQIGITGISHTPVHSRVQVLTNSEDERVFIFVPQHDSGHSFSVWDAMGRRWMCGIVAADALPIDARNWPKGLYFFHLDGLEPQTISIVID